MDSTEKSKKIGHCECCRATRLRQYRLPFAQFRHLDFETIAEASVLVHCGACGAVANGQPEAVSAALDSFVTSAAYANSRQTDQTVLAEDLGRRVTRALLQAKLIEENLGFDRKAPLRILDIGCFDGRLLLELGARFPCAELHGCDVNAHLEFQFPRQSRFCLHRSSLEKVPGAFDLIAMSHSLMYLPDLWQVMDLLCGLLKPRGVVFVQTPNLRVNPCYALLGDQYRYFDADNLGSCFRWHGFDAQRLANRYFPRELVVLAYPRRGSRIARPGAARPRAPRFVRTLSKMARKIQALRSGRLHALGTTVNAAFADSLLGARLVGFIDENAARAGPASAANPSAALSRSRRRMSSCSLTGQAQRRLLGAWRGSTMAVSCASESVLNQRVGAEGRRPRWFSLDSAAALSTLARSASEAAPSGESLARQAGDYLDFASKPPRP